LVKTTRAFDVEHHKTNAKMVALGPQIAPRPVQRRPPPRDPRQKLTHQHPKYPSNQTSRQQRAWL